MASGHTTEVNDNAARASVREGWVASTRHYFVEACTYWRSQPEHASAKVRLVVEGFVHVVCVELDPKFVPHERGKPRRLSMDDAISIAKRHLPSGREDLVNALKNFGNIFHHNQGSIQRTSPKMAYSALLHCAELLRWLDEDVLKDAPPKDYLDALRELEATAPGATPLPSAPVSPAPVSPTATPLPIAVVPSIKKRSALGRRLVIGVASLGVLALVAILVLARVSGSRAGLFTGASPEVDWVDTYNEAIASGDVDRILAIHVLPAPRYFMLQKVGEAQLRALYEGWYRTYGKTHETGFRNCELAGIGADGSRAVRCDTYVDPPLAKGASVIPACLVFRADGRLISRTEIRSFPACPPPPL